MYLSGSEHVNYDSRPVNSTPNEIKNTSINKSENDSNLQLHDSTESLISLPSISKKVTMFVELTTSIHMGKESWSGELINIMCDDFSESSQRRLSESSGNLADVSKNTSPTSTVGSSSLATLPLKPLNLNRFSVISSSSSSSLSSSASTLAKILREGKFFSSEKRNVANLTEERIQELKEKWINSNEIYKVLDYLDRIVLVTDSVPSEDVVKKQTVEEPPKPQLSKIEEGSTPLSTNKIRPVRGKRQAKTKTNSSDSEKEMPRKLRKIDSTELTLLYSKSNFAVGDSVFAKWGDRKFYAAILGEITAEGKWQVNFFDGDSKNLSEDYLIKAEEFTMLGHSVYASQGDDNFTPGIITGCEIVDDVLQYVVARDKGDISVPCQFIYITESQARQIRGKQTQSQSRTPSKQDLSTLTKRSTRSKTKLMLDSPKPSSSGTQTKQLATASDSDDDGHDDATLNVDDVAGVEPESHGVYENGIKLKGKTVAGKMRFSRTKTNDVDATILGPIPDEGSVFFKNLHILLTCTRPQSPKPKAIDTNSSGNGASTDSENYKFSTIPFVKDRLKLQLEMGGALVYNTFDDIPQKMWKSTYLISNRPSISAKYIQCIAAGIKCICHEWVIRCCIDKKRVPIQELPLGWSLERDRFFNSFDKKSSNALKKLHLLIADVGDKNFHTFWSKVCKLADIHVMKLGRDSNLEKINAIISEPGFRDDHIDRAISHNIPILTTNWLIQTLLHGEPRLFDAHKTYKADYVDSD